MNFWKSPREEMLEAENEQLKAKLRYYEMTVDYGRKVSFRPVEDEPPVVNLNHSQLDFRMMADFEMNEDHRQNAYHFIGRHMDGLRYSYYLSQQTLMASRGVQTAILADLHRRLIAAFQRSLDEKED